jgi:hypothetical protein
MELTGYQHPSYAESLSEFGRVRLLARSGGWILERAIPGYEYRDAISCYPIFVCHDWSQLSRDVSLLKGDLVSLAIVTDPFGDYSLADLAEYFTRVTLFKEHYVVDLSRSIHAQVSKHHRYYAKRSLEKVTVEVCVNKEQFLDDWVGLYGELTHRHNLRGIKAFSREAFARQLRVPGLEVLRAVHEGQTVGAHLWYIHESVAYSHLAAFSSAGYKLMASYALYWSALDHFADRVRWVNLGAGAGEIDEKCSGLTQFKRGWAKDTKPAYFCSVILDDQKYTEITGPNSYSSIDYFPIYRKGEFS